MPKDQSSGLMQRLKCRVGLHSGTWSRDVADECCFTRICERCHRSSTRVKHDYDQWSFVTDARCDMVRICQTCSDADRKVAHDWSDPVFDAPNNCQRSILCRRCRTKSPIRIAHSWGPTSESSEGRHCVQCQRCGRTEEAAAPQAVPVVDPERPRRPEEVAIEGWWSASASATVESAGLDLRSDGAYAANGVQQLSGQGRWTRRNDFLVLVADTSGTEQVHRIALDPPYLLFPEEDDCPRVWSTDSANLKFPSSAASSWTRALRSQDAPALAALLTEAGMASYDVERLVSVGQGDTDFVVLELLSQANLVTTSPGAALAVASGIGEFVRASTPDLRDATLLGEWAALIATRNLARTAPGHEVVTTAARWLSWLESRQSRVRSHSLSLLAAEARYRAGQPQLAEQWLLVVDNSQPLDDADRASHQNLQIWVGRALQKADSLPIDYEATLAASQASVQEAIDQLHAMILIQLPAEKHQEAEALIHGAKAALRDDPEAALLDVTQKIFLLASMIGMPPDTTPMGEIRRDVQNLGNLLIDPKRGHDQQSLMQGRIAAQRVHASAHAMGFLSERDTAAWSLAVMEKRLHLPEAAAQTLLGLWADLESQRLTLPDPVRRAGVFAAVPHLFVTLAAELLASGDTERVLDALEGGKGRLLEDTLLKETIELGRAMEVIRTATPAFSSRVLPVNLPTRSHFLSFLVDDDRIFAALETSDGSRHATSVPLSHADLRTYAATVDPSTWGRRLRGFASPPTPSDLPDRLAPLVSWLEPLLANGTLRPDDHICYSPDEELHLIPLQLLNFAGQPLIETFSMSRTHGAKVLQGILQKPPLIPRRACVVEVPARDDAPHVGQGFRATGDRLQKLTACDRLSGSSATIAALDGVALSQRIVHFTTHGTFPRADHFVPGQLMDPNPYVSAGLLLATTAELPSLQDTSGGDTKSLLTPTRIGRLHLAGSHVTTQACSCGLAREGAGGDALGVELAFLLAGAASVLTTHWDVALEPASEFCSRFYRAWIAEGASRASAWRTAALSMHREGRPPYEWAAFSLAGDWR